MAEASSEKPPKYNKSISVDRMSLVSKIRARQTFLRDVIDVEHGLLDQLIERELITQSDAELIESKTTRSDKADMMLDIISDVMRQSRDLETLFLDALNRSDQSHVVNFLHDAEASVGRALPLDEHAMTKVSKNWCFLIDNIDSIHGLLDELWSAKSITSRHKEQLEFVAPTSERNRSLLRIMLRRSNEHFCMFVECLERVKQQHVASRLREATAIGSTSTPASVGDVSPVLIDVRSRTGRTAENRFVWLNNTTFFEILSFLFRYSFDPDTAGLQDSDTGEGDASRMRCSDLPEGGVVTVCFSGSVSPSVCRLLQRQSSERLKEMLRIISNID